MSKEMEKLVEDIMALMIWENPHVAKCIIARIGKAYADGLPLPGEVGRAEIGGAYMYPEPKEYKTDMITMQPVSWWHRTLEKVMNLENGDILIAFRQQEPE